MAAPILSELGSAVRQYTDWRGLNLKRPNAHIAVMSEPFLSHVFNGHKTVESRFSLHKIAPYGQIKPGDLVFMKNGPIVGCFTVAWVKEFDLAEYPIVVIKKEYGDQICADDNFWLQKATKKYATIIGIGKVRHLTPMNISKRDRRGWVKL